MNKKEAPETVELLTEEDTVCIFYSDNADSITGVALPIDGGWTAN